jgi:hypothetical protein
MKWKELSKFKDSTGSIFIKGPFEVDNETYDYKFHDAADSSDSEDYCTEKQLECWIGSEPVVEVK